MTSCVSTNDCPHELLSHESTVPTALLAKQPGEQLFFLSRIHNERFMGPWFEVIAGGTGDRPPPRSKTAATLNFKHGTARTKNKRNKRLKGC